MTPQRTSDHTTPQNLFIVASAAIIIKDKHVLCMRRSKHKDAGAGLWETLSGRIEPNESPLECVCREIREECGVQVEVDARPVRAYQTTRNDVPMIVIVFQARYVAGEVVLSDEHDAFAWLTPAEFRARSNLTQLADSIDDVFKLRFSGGF